MVSCVCVVGACAAQSHSYDKTPSSKKIFTTSPLIKPSAWHFKDPELHSKMCFFCVYEIPDLNDAGSVKAWLLQMFFPIVCRR